jgi:glycine/D-amino acid oxidase-like deaminating enzyme
VIASERAVAIVGAGAIGLATALELRRRAYRVHVVEAGVPPDPDASSTDISKAVRMDYGSDEFYAALAERAIAGWRSWNVVLGEAVYHEVGFLLLTGEPMREGTFEGDSFAVLSRRGRTLERLDGRAIARRFPAWAGAGYVDGYFNPTAGYARSGRTVELLASRVAASGVDLRTRTPVARLVESRSRVTGIELAGGERIDAETVVVAAGAWTPILLPHLADVLRPVAQPVVHFRPSAPQRFAAPSFPVWGADIARTGWYGFPLADGVVKIGNHGPGRIADPRAPRAVDAPTLERFRAFVRAALGDLADAPAVASRICFYCDTPDGDFWIDRDPSRPGLVVAAGGSGHAFKFAPVLGPIVADVVEGRPNADARRFAWRTPSAEHREQARHGDPTG